MDSKLINATDYWLGGTINEATEESHEGLNGYVAFYKGKQKDIYAKTKYEALKKAVKEFGAKKEWDVTVELAEKGGEPVVHIPTEGTDKKKTSKKVIKEVTASEFEVKYAEPPKSGASQEIGMVSVNGMEYSGGIELRISAKFNDQYARIIIPKEQREEFLAYFNKRIGKK